MLHAQAAIGAREAAGLLNLTRRSGRVGCCGGCVGREGLSERLCLLGSLLCGLGAVLAREVGGRRAGVAAPWLEIFGQQLDEVGGKQANHAAVALQAAHPPRAIAGVEALDQVAFDESEVALGLQQSAHVSMVSRGLVQRTSPPHE